METGVCRSFSSLPASCFLCPPVNDRNGRLAQSGGFVTQLMIYDGCSWSAHSGLVRPDCGAEGGSSPCTSSPHGSTSSSSVSG